MPEVKHLNEADLAILYTNIGRGHPTYLDGIISELNNRHSDIRYYCTDVFEISFGTALFAWRLVRWLYRIGASGGIITRLYGCLRKFTGSGEKGGLLTKLLGRDIRKKFSFYSHAIMVAHPILARILLSQNKIIYQHGEMAAPTEAIVSGCAKILVPLNETASAFKQNGIPSENIEITGQCIEVELLARSEESYKKRLDRLSGNDPLTAALFTSGACPIRHLEKIHLIARALFQAGHTVYIFYDQAQQVCNRITAEFRQSGLPVKRTVEEPGRLKLLSAEGRIEANQQVARLFNRFDLFAAPAHERTNWAFGLGLPMLILCPHIGSYAPLNAQLVLKQKTAIEIKDKAAAAHITELIDDLRQSGDLHKMARRGYGHTDITGFAVSAQAISKYLHSHA